MRAASLLACALLAMAPPAFAAGLCPTWGPSTQVGTLDTKIVNEASGLEASARFPGRLYHNNDSGDGLRFYVTDMAGGATRTVEVKGPRPLDIEEMSLGPCDGETCVYLGDIGDNPASRSEVAFTLVVEKEAFEGEQTPLRVVRARYPDGPHNAEAFSLHPNGDLYLVTKPADAVMSKAAPALVYKLTANQLRQTEGVQVFIKVGEIDLPKLMPALPFYAWIPTGLDISPDGARAVLLTYMAVLELNFDLANGVPSPLTAAKDYQIVRPAPLAQQEAIAWLPDASGFLLDSEASKDVAPLMKIACGS
jgi:hypothetical protein